MIERISPDWLGAPHKISAFSTVRSGGASKAPCDDGNGHGGLNLGAATIDDPSAVLENRRRLRACLPAEPVWLKQVHGSTVVDAAHAATLASPMAADASFTTAHDVVCAVLSADCLPVLLCDLRGTVVGAAHAGWRGLASGVLQNTVAAMRSAGGRDLMAWLGPAIGPAHFEVGAEVHAVFVDQDGRANAAFRKLPGPGDKYLADLYALARLVLADSGVQRIAGGDHCTVTETTRFFSYRRDHETGRLASLIWMRKASHCTA